MTSLNNENGFSRQNQWVFANDFNIFQWSIETFVVVFFSFFPETWLCGLFPSNPFCSIYCNHITNCHTNEQSYTFFWAGSASDLLTLFRFGWEKLLRAHDSIVSFHNMYHSIAISREKYTFHSHNFKNENADNIMWNIMSWLWQCHIFRINIHTHTFNLSWANVLMSNLSFLLFSLHISQFSRIKLQ